MRRVPQLGIVAVLAVVAALGFRGSLEGWGFVVPAISGMLIALIALLLAQHHRLYVGESVALSTALFAFGGAGATLGSYPDFFRGLIGGWADLLSSAPPATLTAELRVLPYAVSWVAMLIGGELARRATRPVLPVIGPFAAMGATALVTAGAPDLALLQGVAMAVGALTLGLLHQWLVVEPLRGDDATASMPRRASALGLTGLIAAVALLVGPNLPLAGANERFDLRDHQERPWDPLSEPSPLVTLKASLKEGRSDDEVFTVTADEPLTRWTTAVLASYSGTVWAVADEGPDGPAEFEPVDRRFPSSPEDPIAGDQASVSYRIEFAEPTLWVPIAGRVLEVDGSTGLRFNEETGTVAAPQRLAAGTTLQITSAPRQEPKLVDLMSAETPPVDEGAELELVPPQLRNLAGDVFEGIDPGPSRVAALAERFTQLGFYDHSDAARPGHNLARLDDFLAEPDRIVGYAEQYAATAGVLSQLSGVPTRVVVGYQIPPERYVDRSAVVLADDIGAWIEIATVDFGWVPIDVTPDRAREPQDESLGVTVTDVAIPNPPPSPPPPPDDQVAARPDTQDGQLDDEPTDADEPSFLATIPTPAIVATTAIGLPIVVLGLLGCLVVAIKGRRRKRRQQGPTRSRVAGAWSELLDGYAEAGVMASKSTTPGEVVATLLRDEPSAIDAADDLHQLAEQVDRAAFHPTSPDDAAADEAWRRCTIALESLRSSRSGWHRLAMRTDPRPLTRRGAP